VLYVHWFICFLTCEFFVSVMNRHQQNLIPDDGSSMFLQNIGRYVPGYSASLLNYKIVILYSLPLRILFSRIHLMV